MTEPRYRVSRQAGWQARGHMRVWGIWDTVVTAWAVKPELPYSAAIEKLGQLEMAEAADPKNPIVIEEDRVTADCIEALKRYVQKQTEQGYHCWIDRGPARDKFGIFAALGLDGKTVIRCYDRESGRWY